MQKLKQQKWRYKNDSKNLNNASKGTSTHKVAPTALWNMPKNYIGTNHIHAHFPLIENTCVPKNLCTLFWCWFYHFVHWKNSCILIDARLSPFYVPKNCAGTVPQIINGQTLIQFKHINTNQTGNETEKQVAQDPILRLNKNKLGACKACMA